MERKVETIFHYKNYCCVILSLEADSALSVFQDHYPERYLCGYVKVPYWHPMFEKHYNDIPIRCYGGLTFSDRTLLGTNKHGWWIGFDCAHADDAVNPKDINFVIQECKNIVD